MGPSVHLLNALPQDLGGYLDGLVASSFRTAASVDAGWLGDWTLFYWGWWIAWAPFVGMFIARISRGRTIREFIGGVLLVPVALTFVWMTVFGNTALHLETSGLVIDIITAGGAPDPPVRQRIFWALTEGLVAAVLLVAGGLQALQTAALTTALPFAVVMLFICWGLLRGLSDERRADLPLPRRPARRPPPDRPPEPSPSEAP